MAAIMDEPIRILQVVTTLNKGGIENLLMNLYREIDRTKFQFDFLVHSLEECFFNSEVESLGGRVYPIPRFSVWRFDKQFKEYDRFFKKHREYKIVHSHIDMSSLGVLRAACKVGVPTRICHMHLTNAYEKKTPLSYRCKKAVFPLTSRYLTHRFACSKLTAKDAYGVKRNDVFVLKNGVDTKKYQFNVADRDKKRKELGWNDKLVVFNVANFVPHKNHSFLIDVFSKIARQNPNAVLALAGGGCLQAQIESQVNSLGLSERVQFLGIRNDVPDLLKAADVFLFPSLYEGFPVSLIEAQVAGIPIVVSDTVTNETDVTDLLRFVSLNESQEQWAQIALEETNRKRKPRESYAEVVKNAGFDISVSAKELTDFYLTEYQKSSENLGGRSCERH